MKPAVFTTVALFGVVCPASAYAQVRTYGATVVDSTQLHAVPAASPTAALAGKVPGARVYTISGHPGAEPAIVLRGAVASMTAMPLIVIDGVVTHIALADLNTDDIERIEVVSGAAGGASYGLYGANGVIRLFTKRARDDAAHFRTELGRTTLPRSVLASRHHHFLLDASGQFQRDGFGNRIADPNGIADNDYPVLYDMAGAVLESGNVLSSYADAARGLDTKWGRLRGFASLQHHHDHGVLAIVNGYSRQSGRLNLDYSIGSKVDLSAGGFLAQSGQRGGSLGSVFYLLRRIEPNVPLDSATFSNPHHYLKLLDSTEIDHSRGSWNLRATYRPFGWLTADALMARDRDRDDQTVVGAPNAGSFRVGRDAYTDVSLTTRRRFERFALDGSLRAGLSDEARTVRRQSPGMGSSVRNRGKAYTLSTELQRDRLTVEGLVRQDNPTFIARKHPVYHRLSAAYRFGEDRVVRVTQGTAAPTLPDDDIDFYLGMGLCPIFGPCDFLRLPYARELEIGAEIPLLRRFRVGYTYARQRTADQMFYLQVPQPAPVNARWDNAATVVAQTHELTVGVDVLSRADLYWRVDLNAWRTRSRITDLYGPSVMMSPSPISGLAMFRVADGETLGTMYGYGFIRTAAQLDETIRTGRLSGTTADYRVNEEGYVVRAADFQTVNERPLIAWHCTSPAPGPCTSSDAQQKIGDANPDLNLGINTRLRWKSFSAHALVTVAIGGHVYNFIRHVLFSGMNEETFDQSAKPFTERKPAAYYFGFYGSSSPNEYFVESGTHAKVRELGIDWRLPVARDTRVGIVGRNLLTMSRYRGYDPDAAAGTRSMFGSSNEAVAHPAYRAIGVRVQLAAN